MKRLVALLAIMLLSFGLSYAQSVTVDLDTPASQNPSSPLAIGIDLTNPSKILGMSLGFNVWSPAGGNGPIAWTWRNMGAAGYGTSKAVTIVAGSRLDPPGTVFDLGGFLVSEYPTPNWILVGGAALNGGLPAGPRQHMVDLNISFSDPGDNLPRQLCVDSITLPSGGDWVYTDEVGSGSPTIGWQVGGVCFEVLKPANQCPVFGAAPSAVAVSHCAVGSVTVHATDPEGDPVAYAIVSTTGAGTASVNASTGVVTYTPGIPADVNNTIDVVVSALDAFHTGGCNTQTVQFNVTNNAPTISCGAATQAVAKGNTIVKSDIVGSDVDACDTKTYTLVSIVPAAVGAASLSTSGVFTWATNDPGDIGLHTVTVAVTDGYATAQCTFSVDVLATEPFEVTIQKAHDVLQGHYYGLSIDVTKGTLLMGGFDLLISYDVSALSFVDAVPGSMLTQCGWEYFTYRFGANGNCGNGCPSGLVRIIALAETNNGAHHPTCYGPLGQLAVLNFLVSNNRTLECQFVPVRFFWYDCGDNTFSSRAGDSLFVSRYVFDYSGTGSNPYTEITNNAYGFPGWFGAPDACLAGDKTRPIRFIDFKNGGIDIVCADSIDARGDLNMNGVRNEIADAVMFTNYFITGLSAFGTHVEGSIAASDVNADGASLTVADLVYLIRVIQGDAQAYAKPRPDANVSFTAQGSTVTYDANENVGATLLVFNVKSGSGTVTLGEGAQGMDVVSGVSGNELRVLVYNIGPNAIASGKHTLMTIDGTVELVSAEAATFTGSTMTASVKNVSTMFELAQNTPNPFNPTTKIAFSMPIASDYSIAIYNVAGQLVKEYNGHSEAGTVQVIWDGTDSNHSSVASGIYFYKASASNFSATKKMVLMK